MTRRRTRRCAADSCRETGHFEFSSWREERRHYEAEPEWRCIRHTRPDELLSLDNDKRVSVITAGKSKRFPDLEGLFWQGPGAGSGFAHGVGWKAFADDFPAGTRLRVTVEVLPPIEGAP